MIAVKLGHPATATLWYHRQGDIVAARFEPLGLTAYGDTDDEAIEALKGLFNKFVAVSREEGRLEQRLLHSGVEWYWEDEYPANKPSFEDTNLSVPHIREPLEGWREAPTMRAIAA